MTRLRHPPWTLAQLRFLSRAAREEHDAELRLAALRERRAEAYEAVKAAQARRDTRAIHDAIQRLAKATHAVMREELRT